MAQAGWAVAELRRASPGSEYEVEAIRTSGDADQRPLFELDRRGAFEREVDEAVAGGRVDFAVHSLKDVPTELPPGLALACVPRRAPAGDALVSPGGAGIGSLRPGAVVGTSSLRRAVQARRLRPDIRVRPVRGNVETRIGRIGGGYDAVILAQAGLGRLGLSAPSSPLPEDEFVPSPGQGALALVAREGDARAAGLLALIQHGPSRAEADAERALSAAVGSGCRFPVGARARAAGGRLEIRAAAFSADGAGAVRVEESGPAGDPGGLGRRAGGEMLRRGAGELALNWREAVEEWNRQ